MYKLLPILLFVFIGCTSSTNQTKVSNKKQINQIPNWILNPSKPNQICSVGSTNNIKDAKIKALLNAKSNISKQIELHIYKQSNSTSICNTKECKESYETFSRHQSSQMLNNIKTIDTYIDNENDIYYLRACTIKNNNIFEYKKDTISSPYQTTKKACIVQSNYPNKTIDEQKNILIQKAKQQALNELYGELLYSQTNYNNGKLDSNKIRQTAIGTVRIKGNPIFYQGEEFGEICSDVTSYVTKEDIEKYSPKKVKLNNFCFTNRKVSMEDIEQASKYEAYKQMISQYKPSLKLTGIQAQNYIHGFKISNNKYDFNTKSYCFDAVGVILPYELELNKNQLPSFDNSKLLSGLKATFYQSNDHKLKKPIYTTYIDTLNLQYQKLPSNENIKKDTLYTIKIEGFIKSDKKVKHNLNIYADVYSATLSINSNHILSTSKARGTTTLKKGFNHLKLIVKTANRYDIKIISDNNIESLYTNKLN